MGLISRVSSRTYRFIFFKNGPSQKPQGQKSTRQGTEAESTFATMVPIQDRKQNPIQREKATLETNQARTLNCQSESCKSSKHLQSEFWFHNFFLRFFN